MKRRDKQLLIGGILFSIVVLLAVISIFYTPYDIYEMNPAIKNQGPSGAHLMGTDNYGRDIFSRIMVGSRFTLIVAVSTVAGCTVIACILGMFSGYYGGMVDEIIMRIIDAINSFPGMLIALTMATVLSYGKYTVIIALCIMFIPSFTRIVRTGALQYRDKEFIKNIKVFGASDLRIIFVHIFPNILPMLFSTIVIGLSNAILAESGMSYLGLGIMPPNPSFGLMLKDAQTTLYTNVWYALAPGLMIVITIIGLNLIGEGLRKRVTNE